MARPPPSSARLALGFLVAPLAVPLLHAALELGLPHEGPPGYVRSLQVHAIETIASWTTPITYGFALAVGIPVVLALRRTGRLTVPWLVAESVAGGAAVSLVPLVLLMASGSATACFDEEACWARLLVVPGVAALFAAVVAGVFCAIAGVPLRGRAGAPPDQAAPPG